MWTLLEKGNTSTIVLWQQIPLYLFDTHNEFVQYNWKWEKSPLLPPNYYQELCNEFEKFHYCCVTLLFTAKRNCANKDNKGKRNAKAFSMHGEQGRNQNAAPSYNILPWSLSEGQWHSPLHSRTSISEERNYRWVVQITLGTQLQKECVYSKNKITINSASLFRFPDEGRTSYTDVL